MIFSLDIWLLPAIGAASSSYLVSLLWERIRSTSAPSGMTAGFLAALSFLMGAICSWYREAQYERGLDNNIVTMFIAGASTTFLWLLLRKYFIGYKDGARRKLLDQR